ncbi:mercury methylation ferredoxin HgcB [Fundidesulfovibrio agrisoli]|uniref:mercury methylation ferredoxin HgcB n=1 Tax=Fundidesulfovibrio agrisoli TaxID=2922717 RepID=UPI001FAC3115|nr:mercury methylation ferredoxin HgcB [Fundidesulfovibrio agrisoli]
MSGCCRYIPGVVTLRMDPHRCGGCGMCAQVCPHGVFVVEGGTARIADRDACMECGACALNCSSGAIEVEQGVGCARAIIHGWITGGPPSCDCGGDGGSTCC